MSIKTETESLKSPKMDLNLKTPDMLGNSDLGMKNARFLLTGTAAAVDLTEAQVKVWAGIERGSIFARERGEHFRLSSFILESVASATLFDCCDLNTPVAKSHGEAARNRLRQEGLLS